MIRNFIWMGVNKEGLQETGILQGLNLLDAIEKEYRTKKICIYWEDDCCDNWKSLSTREKARQILWYIEESYVEGDSSNQISVIDITDHDNPIIVFPKGRRLPNFNIKIIGIKYVIKSWIPAECENPQIYDSMEEAVTDLTQLQLMQPENRYEIEEKQD